MTVEQRAYILLRKTIKRISETPGANWHDLDSPSLFL